MITGVKALSPMAQLPEYATERSACADIRACLDPERSSYVVVYTPENVKGMVSISAEGICLLPNFRALVPTGLALDPPEGYSVRTHPRSGLSLKHAATIVCGEGVIDEDYQDELFVPMINLSSKPVWIEHGERIAQAELVKDLRCAWEFVEELSDKQSSRAGGFGHSGKL